MNDATTLDVTEIERRLGYSDAKDLALLSTPTKRRQPPLRNASNKSTNSSKPTTPKQKQQTTRTRRTLSGSELDRLAAAVSEANFITPNTHRKLISASKRSRELMRQVSGLGMEDPVFGTKEKGLTHPSQIFDDMSINDIPEDMQDMVSFASDPTATLDEENGSRGIDMAMFQASMGELHHTSRAEISNMEVIIPTTNTTTAVSPAVMAAASAAMAAQAAASEATSKSVGDSISTREDILNGDEQQHQQQQHKTQQTNPGKSLRRISVRVKRKESSQNMQQKQTPPVSPGTESSFNPHASATSLNLDDVINAGRADRERMQQTPKEAGHSSGRSRNSQKSRNSKGERSTGARSSGSSSMDDSNNLIREAALAMHMEGNTSKDLIVAALSQSFQDMNCTPDELLRQKPRHRLSGVTKSSTDPALPAYEAPPLGSPESRKARFTAKQRSMPSFNALFPDTVVKTPTTTRRKIRAGGRREPGRNRPVTPTTQDETLTETLQQQSQSPHQKQQVPQEKEAKEELPSNTATATTNKIKAEHPLGICNEVLLKTISDNNNNGAAGTTSTMKRVAVRTRRTSGDRRATPGRTNSNTSVDSGGGVNSHSSPTQQQQQKQQHVPSSSSEMNCIRA